MNFVLLKMSKHVANKNHTCIWCGESILSGERYQREVSVFEGQWQFHKWHPECEEAAQKEFKATKEYDFDAGTNPRPKKE